MKSRHILECTFNEIAVRGIRHASVDSIAARMHISKKTIYDLFENKEKLLLSSLKYKIGKIIEDISVFSQKNDNVLCSIIDNTVYLFKFFNSVTPLLYEEIALFPSIERYCESVKSILLDAGRKRIEEGKIGGYFRKDADFSIVGRLFESQVLAMSKDNGEKYTPVQICFYSLMIILRGICTDKGLKMIEETVNEEYIERILR